MMSDVTFTFWQWFYDIMMLVREHAQQPWNDG
jgi:hypothetical protein